MENKESTLVIQIERDQSYKGFAKGKLLLHYEGKSEPLDVVFVSPPLSL
jgi:hypothetical protein